MAEKPLHGIKVLDFTWALAGPLLTQILANWGAEVIKVESKEQMRMMWDRSTGIYNAVTAGKRTLTLNLSKPKGLEAAKRLVAWADVVTENFAGGSMERMGLGYEDLRKVKPDIIMFSSCALGHTGPAATHPGYAGPIVAMAGFNEILGWPDRQPQQFGEYSDFIAPQYGAIAILAALDYRHRTGKGQYIDQSQYEDALHFLAPVILDYEVNKRVATRMGNRSSYAAPHGVYRCQGEDRWCAIAVCTDEEWESFCRVIGDPAWTEDPKFGTLMRRKENEKDLDRLVEEWTIIHIAEEVMTMMQEAGVGAGVVRTGRDLLEDDPQLKHRDYYWELDQPGVGKHHAMGSSFLLSKAPYEMRAAPLMGEDNEYVFKDILGMSDDEIADLVIDGVVE